MSQLWSRSGNDFHPYDPSRRAEPQPLGPGVYQVVPGRWGMYLEKVSDKFELPEKLYGLNKPFIERVKRTVAGYTENIGILLNGTRGTGKTVTCEVICNELALPTLLITQPLEGLVDFLADLDMECIIFFDEFEKTFPANMKEGGKLLPLMDGALKRGKRKIFLMTTNELFVEQNLIQRPGRVRYLKTFNNLAPDHVKEIVEDRLIDKNRTQTLCEFISQLETITVDIVIAIVDEVNIHGENPETFKDVFNIKKVQEFWAIYQVIDNDADPNKPTEKQLSKKARIYPAEISKQHSVGYDFMINGQTIGEVAEVLDYDLLVIQPYKEEAASDEDPDPARITIRLERLSSVNRSYARNRRVSAGFDGDF